MDLIGDNDLGDDLLLSMNKEKGEARAMKIDKVGWCGLYEDWELRLRMRERGIHFIGGRLIWLC